MLAFGQRLGQHTLRVRVIPIAVVRHSGQPNRRRHRTAHPRWPPYRIQVGARLRAGVAVRDRNQGVVAQYGRRRSIRDGHAIAVQRRRDGGGRAGHHPALAAPVEIGVVAFAVHAGQRLDRGQDRAEIGAGDRNHLPLDLDQNTGRPGLIAAARHFEPERGRRGSAVHAGLCLLRMQHLARQRRKPRAKHACAQACLGALERDPP
jgi:hypothetical protein